MRSLYLITCLSLLISVMGYAQMTDDVATTEEDVPVSVVVSDNDDVFLAQPSTVDLDTGLSGRQTTANTPEGSYLVNDSGNVTFTPATDFHGTAVLQYSMKYGLLGTTVGTADIIITVTAVNDAPVANNNTASTTEDALVTLNVLANDTDVDNAIDPTTVNITNAVGGTFTVDNTGEVTYTPTANFNGTATANYTVQDISGAASNQATITITVTPVNDPPVAVADVGSTMEGDPVVVEVLDNDSDLDGTLVTSSIVLSDATGGTFSANSLGEVTYTPTAGFNGTASATYTVKDNGGLSSNAATVTITVGAVNDAPVAVNDQTTINEDASPVSINILSNDTDADGTINASTVTLSEQVNGTFSVNSSGIVTYTPSENFFGTATAKYSVKDAEGLASNEATITVTVSPVNDPPTFALIENQRILENSANKSLTITGISSGPSENETVTITATSANTGIMANPTITYNGTASTATLTYKPEPDKFGTVTITVEATDQGPAGTNKFTRTFQIEIVEVKFTSVPVTVAAPDAVYEYVITVSDVSETLTIVSTQKPAWLTLTSLGKNLAKLSGTPPANATITNPITLQLKDEAAILDQQAFTLVVNRVPSVSSFGLETQEDNSISFTVENFSGAYTDEDNHPLSEIQFTALPKHGILRLNNTAVAAGDKIAVTSIQNISYVPLTDYNGLDTLMYKASDGYSYSNSAAHVHYLITPVNDAPVFDFVETNQLQYELGSEIPIKFATASTVKDVDDTQLTGAEIGIRFLNYQPKKELLLFNDTLNIKGAFNEAAGILVLSGNSSVENYQAAIRSVRFNYINLVEVKVGTLEIYVNLTDGKNTGDSKSRLIDLIYTFKDLTIPNAFSPNTDDLVNSTWVIRSPNTPDGSVPYDDARITVYNKHGAMVYETVGFEQSWDGTFKGEPLPSDTYYYTIELKYNHVKYRGVVTILR